MAERMDQAPLESRQDPGNAGLTCSTPGLSKTGALHSFGHAAVLRRVWCRHFFHILRSPVYRVYEYYILSRRASVFLLRG